MTTLKLIDATVLQEPFIGRQHRYYATDQGLALFLSAMHSFPPLSLARLTRSYPVERQDLLARLARPGLHLALSTLVTRLITEGAPSGEQLVSYQQPWQHRYLVGDKHKLLSSDAALLIQQAQAATYAFLVYVDTAQPTDQRTRQFLKALLEMRQRLRLARHPWPELLILAQSDRLPIWAHLLLESRIAQTTSPLTGGLTTLDALTQQLSTPIWYDLVALTETADPAQVMRLPFAHLLRDPASLELAEHVSRQRHFFATLLGEAATPPPRMKERLTRSVGNSLQEEAAHLTPAHLQEHFSAGRSTRQSTYGTGLLTLALTEQEKALLTWVAHHPLLDLPTLQAVLHPHPDTLTISPLEETISYLCDAGLLETRGWPAGKTPLEQERYLLTDVALKFIATREGVPYSVYFLHPKYYKESDDEQTRRQQGTRGLARQMAHTHGLYTLMRQLYTGTYTRGEVLVRWYSAHEAAREYRDTISHRSMHARPDAELLFVPTPLAHPTSILLEYDRATTGEREYTRKFSAYLDYQQATGITLPLLLVVTPSPKAAQKIQQVLSALGGGLQVVILLERDLLAHGLTLALPQLSP
jgi:hypothetical protein